jgi:hypothetical protein
MDGRRGQAISFYSLYNFEKFYKKGVLKDRNMTYNLSLFDIVITS